MGKQDFLNKLRKALRHTFTKQEINEILADYEGFFISGMNDGKSEDEICVELGNPEVVALDLKKELPRKRLLFSKNFFIPFAVLLTLCVFWYIIKTNKWPYVIFNRIALFGLIPFIMSFALVWKRRAIPKTAVKSSNSRIFLSAGHILLLFITLTAHTYIIKSINLSISIMPVTPNNIIEEVVFNIIKSFDIEKLTDSFAITLYTSSFISIIIMIAAVYGFYRSSPFYSTLIIHAAGVMNVIGGIIFIVDGMQDIKTLHSGMNTVLIIYLSSIAMTIIFIPITYILSRKVEK